MRALLAMIFLSMALGVAHAQKSSTWDDLLKPYDAKTKGGGDGGASAPPVPSIPAQSYSQSTGCKVTLDQYLALRTSMSYRQVTAILGCPGTEMSRVEIAGQSAVMYMWNGSGFGNMNVMIQNGGLVSKAQFNLR